MYATQMIIGGSSLPGTGNVFTRDNPATGQQVNLLSGASAEDALRAADAAASAFREWSRTGPGLRRDILLRAEQLMHEREPAIVAAMQAELSAAPSWASFNIHIATNIVRECASLTTMICGRTIPSDIPGLTAMTHRRPCGVILSIAPWNGPIILAARAIAMPLACGNTVVLKGSELCPETHRLLVDCFNDAGNERDPADLISGVPPQMDSATLDDDPAFSDGLLHTIFQLQLHFALHDDPIVNGIGAVHRTFLVRQHVADADDRPAV